MKNESYTMTYIGVHALFLNENGKMLILRRSADNRYMPLKWEVPGGKMQTGESVEVAIKREVFEETGLEISDIMNPLSVYVNLSQIPVREDLQIIFSCKIVDTQKKINLSRNEHDSYEWINPEQLKDYDLMEYVKYYCEKAMAK